MGVVGDGLKLHWVTTVYELRTEVLMQWTDCNDEQRLRPDETNPDDLDVKEVWVGVYYSSRAPPGANIMLGMCGHSDIELETIPQTD